MEAKYISAIRSERYSTMADEKLTLEGIEAELRKLDPSESYKPTLDKLADPKSNVMPSELDLFQRTPTDNSFRRRSALLREYRDLVNEQNAPKP